jgi:hypothetical protein
VIAQTAYAMAGRFHRGERVVVLPSSGFVHAKAPELEVYPPDRGDEDGVPVEFWLPIAC